MRAGSWCRLRSQKPTIDASEFPGYILFHYCSGNGKSKDNAVDLIVIVRFGNSVFRDETLCRWWLENFNTLSPFENNLSPADEALDIVLIEAT